MKNVVKIFVLAIVVGTMFASCTPSRTNSPGFEYAPDMYRSPSLEVYVDNGMDEYIIGVEEARAQRNTLSTFLPVAGTIAYGKEDYVYPYENNNDGYERAGRYLSSSYPMTKNNIERGKEIYDIMCTHCHGASGRGDGKMVENEHILGIPDYATKLKDLSEGKMYHTITYGKGLMGSHASQLSPAERWQVINYIHVMQNDGKMPKYNKDGYAIGYERYWGDYGYRQYLLMTGTNLEDLDRVMMERAEMADVAMMQGEGGELQGGLEGVEGQDGKRKWWEKVIDKGAEKVGEIKENRADRKEAREND